MQRPAEPVERLRMLSTLPQHELEALTCASPIGSRERGLSVPNQLRHTHRPGSVAQHARLEVDPRTAWARWTR
jgi:hypothetical protein